jgi:fructose-bisphosphate aldolase class II
MNLERLKEIRARIDTPLVLHGGSGLTDEDFKNTIKYGIAKVNIFTDLCLAGNKAMNEGLANNMEYLDIRNLKVETMKQAVMNKMKIFGSVNKA